MSEIKTGSLSDLLSDYGSPAEIVTSEEPQTETVSNEAVSEPSQQSSENWKGNSDYYQTGKKAGQKRPTGKGMKVSYKESTEPTTISADLISATLFLTIIDLLIPGLICLLHNFMSKKKINRKDMQLDKDTKRQLEPVAEAAKRQIFLTASPTTLFIFTMIAMYAMQYFYALSLSKEEKK